MQLSRVRDVLLRAGMPGEASENGLTVTLRGRELPESAALELDLELQGDRALLGAEFGVDARTPQTLLELLGFANDLNAVLRVGRAFVEPEQNGDELGGAALRIEASLSIPSEAHLAALPDFVSDFGADVRAALSALTGGEG